MTGDLYCTVGRGMEEFCRAELRSLGASVHHSVEGKMFFSPETHGPQLRLRTAERVFITAYHNPQELDTSNRAVTAFQLQRLLAEQINWGDCIELWRTYHPNINSTILPFRVNVRISGRLRAVLQPLHVARSLSKRLAATTECLRPSVRNPLVAIDLHLSDEHLTVGVALSLTSSALGGPSHGLRSTTAAAMVMCLGLHQEEFSVTKFKVVLDPMCGKGSLLYELSNTCALLGVDNNKQQLNLAKVNVNSADFVLGDARHLPLQPQSVDHIICDLPFGLQHSTESELRTLLPSVITDMMRVVKPDSSVVLLTSAEQLEYLNSLVSNSWTVLKKFNISLGLLEAVISVYRS